MSIVDNNPVNAAYTNSRLASKQANNTLEGIQTLDNSLSGASVINLQQAVNNLYAWLGKVNEAETAPSISSTNYSLLGDELVVILDNLDAALFGVQTDLASHVASTAAHGVTEVVGTTEAQTLSNKTFSSPVIVTDATNSTNKDTGSIVTEGGLGVELDAHIGGSLTVEGDLTVNGTVTTVNSATIDVTDANITVNKGGTEATANAQGAGITVEMSDATDAALSFDSTLNSKWKAGPIGSQSEIITSNDVQTLTNKTFDADQNTVTNIDNGNIKVGAAINISKISFDGNLIPTVDNTRSIGSSISRLANIFSYIYTVADTAIKFVMRGDVVSPSTGTPSGGIASKNSAGFTLTGGEFGEDASYPVRVETGNRSTAGNTASVTLRTGTPTSGTRGDIILNGRQIDASSTKIVNVADPTAAQDAATKNYVDTELGAFSPDPAVGGDLSGTASAATVIRIQSTPVPAPVLANDGQALVYDHGTTSFVYDTVTSDPTLAGDVTGLGSANTVEALRNKTLPALTTARRLLGTDSLANLVEYKRSGLSPFVNANHNPWVDDGTPWIASGGLTVTAAPSSTVIFSDDNFRGTFNFSKPASNQSGNFWFSNASIGEGLRSRGSVYVSLYLYSNAGVAAGKLKLRHFDSTNSAYLFSTGLANEDLPAIPAGKSIKVTQRVFLNSNTALLSTRLIVNDALTDSYSFDAAGLFVGDMPTVDAPMVEAPTITRLTSGSGTYTPPANAKMIRVTAVGGGGGGGASATGGSPTGGGNGTATTFGSVLTCNGGSGGALATGGGGGGGGSGGTVSISAPASNVFSVQGGDGNAGSNQVTTLASGGIGGASYFGGAGRGGLATAANPEPGKANTGSGGGGAGSVASAGSGGGGGAGGAAQIILEAPFSGGFAYSVGTGGTGGAAGTGTGGANGGSGVIIIEEFSNSSGVLSTTEMLNRTTDVKATKTGGSQTAAGAWQTVTNYSVEVSDTLGEFNPTTGIFTAKSKKKLFVAGQVGYPGLGVFLAGARIAKNGSPLQIASYGVTGNGTPTGNNCSGTVDVVPGDTIELQAYQNAAASHIYSSFGDLDPALYIAEIPDLSVYSVFGQTDYQQISIFGPVAVSGTVFQNLTSIVLQAGTWDITARAEHHKGASTVGPYSQQMALSQWSGSTTTDHVQGYNAVGGNQPGSSAFATKEYTIPPIQLNLFGPTTIYLKGQSDFAEGEWYRASIRARKIK